MAGMRDVVYFIVYIDCLVSRRKAVQYLSSRDEISDFVKRD